MSQGFLQMEMINVQGGGNVNCLDLIIAYFTQVPNYYAM